MAFRPPIMKRESDVARVVRQIYNKGSTRDSTGLLYKVLNDLEDDWPPPTKLLNVRPPNFIRVADLLAEWEDTVTAYGTSPLNAIGASIIYLADGDFLDTILDAEDRSEFHAWHRILCTSTLIAVK